MLPYSIYQITVHRTGGSPFSSFQLVIQRGYFSLTKAELFQLTPPSFQVYLLFAVSSLHILVNMDLISLQIPVHLLVHGTDGLVLGFSSVGLGN